VNGNCRVFEWYGLAWQSRFGLLNAMAKTTMAPYRPQSSARFFYTEAQSLFGTLDLHQIVDDRLHICILNRRLVDGAHFLHFGLPAWPWQGRLI
jgi:hypothetical protein